MRCDPAPSLVATSLRGRTCSTRPLKKKTGGGSRPPPDVKLDLPCRHMKIISIRQPWASLIVSGVKDVENRTWSTRYRGPVLIHASRTADKISDDEFQARFGMA